MKFIRNLFLVLTIIAALGSAIYVFIDVERAKQAMGAAMIFMAFHIIIYLLVGTTGVKKNND